MRRARLGALLTTGADPDPGPEHRVLTGATG
jgi:hypothetical protein